MTYEKRSKILAGLIAGTVLPVVAAASPVSMDLVGVEGPSMGGVYTSPYQALVGPAGLTHASQFTSSNSTLVNIYCDDFLREVGVGLIWQANVTSLSALTGISSPLGSLKFDTTGTATQQQQDYMAEAWLAEQISKLNQNTTAGKEQAGELSYAMWSIFDPTAASSKLTGTELTDSENDLTAARNAVKNDSPNEFSNVYVYTPDPKDASQEYLVVKVPEPGTLALLGAALAVLAGVAFRRRRPRAVRAY